MVNRQPGLVRIANEIATKGHVADVQSTGQGQALQSISSDFGKVSAKIGALADHAAAVEGKEAGRLAGLDPEFRPTKQLTIRGEAYDQAGLQVYETRTRSEMLGDLDGVFEQHQNNPAKLNEVLAEKRRAYIGNALPEIRPELETTFDGVALRYNRQATRLQMERITAEQKGALTTELGEGLKRLSQNAYGLGLDAEADKVMQAGLDQLGKTLQRRDPRGELLMTPTQAAKLLDDTKTEIATARIRGAFDRLPGLDAKGEFIKTLKDDFGASRGLASEFDENGFQRIVSSLEADWRSARTEQGVGVRALAEDVRNATRILEKGYDIGADDIAGLRGRLAGVAGAEGVAELSTSLDQAEGLLAFQKQARTQTPAAVDAFIAQERRALEGGEADGFRVSRLEIATKLSEEMRGELKQDPLGWADRVGLVKVAPLDVSSPEAANAAIGRRIATAEEIGAVYGQAPVYLRPDEKRMLSVKAAQGGKDMLEVSTMLAAGAGERAPKVIAEIADDAPVVALVAGHMSIAGRTPAALDAADGIALAKTDGFKGRAPSKEKAIAAAAEVLGDVLSDQPRDQSAVIAAANAIYEVRAVRQGATTFDPDLWKTGLREILGETKVAGVTYGGIATQGFWGANPVILPPAMRQDALEDVLSMITPGSLSQAGLKQPIGATGKQLSTKQIAAGTLVMLSPGKYAVAMGDPSAPGEERWLMQTGGEPFLLDFDKLAPILQRRRPDLWKGPAR